MRSWELVYHPEFEPRLSDRSVRAVNGCRRESSDSAGHLFNATTTLGIGLDQCYRLGGKRAVAYAQVREVTRLTEHLEAAERGRRRYFGFGPGHGMHVVGTLHGGALHASAVFGGDAGGLCRDPEGQPLAFVHRGRSRPLP